MKTNTYQSLKESQALTESRLLFAAASLVARGEFPEIADSAAYEKLLEAWSVCQAEISKHYALSEAEL